VEAEETPVLFPCFGIAQFQNQRMAQRAHSACLEVRSVFFLTEFVATYL
jgi:hypothetical protein